MLGNPQGGPERNVRVSGWSGMVRGTLREVRDWLGRCRTGQETFREVRDGSGDPRGGLGQVGGPLGRSSTIKEPSGRSGTGQETLEGTGRVGEVRHG